MSDQRLIVQTIERLRADLIATNAALIAVLTSMPPDQQRQALTALAEISVRQEQACERAATPDAEQALQQVHAATGRLYEALQGAVQMRLRKLGEPPL